MKRVSVQRVGYSTDSCGPWKRYHSHCCRCRCCCHCRCRCRCGHGKRCCHLHECCFSSLLGEPHSYPRRCAEGKGRKGWQWVSSRPWFPARRAGGCDLAARRVAVVRCFPLADKENLCGGKEGKGREESKAPERTAFKKSLVLPLPPPLPFRSIRIYGSLLSICLCTNAGAG